MVTRLGVANSHLFFVYCIVALISSFFVLRSLAAIYAAFSTYHYVGDGDNSERLSRKVFLVGTYNVLGVLISTLLVFGVQSIAQTIDTLSSTFQFVLSADALLAIAILSVVFNSSIRLTSLAGALIPRSKEEAEYVRDIVLGFGFGFWSSLCFFLVIGFGIGIVAGNVPSLLSSTIRATISIPVERSFERAVVMIVIAPYSGAILSEFCLYKFLSVPDGLKSYKN